MSFQYVLSSAMKRIRSKARSTLSLASIGALGLAASVAFMPTLVNAESSTINFESPTYNLGNINGQHGWMALGSAGLGCAVYDEGVVNNVLPPSGFGSQSFRISDSVTSGCFGDQAFAAPLVDSVGETTSSASSYSAGIKQTYFVTQFDIASATPNALQPGLHISISPDRGDGSRMSYLRFEDQADGIHVFFDDVLSAGTVDSDTFNESDIATLDRTMPHNIKLALKVVEGPSNDVVKVWIDGNLVKTGTSWEDYYRYDSESASEQSPRIVKTVLFRAGGTANAGNAGNGFLFDNLTMQSLTIPTVASPTITIPANNVVLTSAQLTKIDWTDSSGTFIPPVTYQYQAFSDANYTSNVYVSPAPLTSSEIPTPGTPDGTYYVRVKAFDTFGNSSAWSNDASNPYKITVDNIAPAAPVHTYPANNSTVYTHNFTFTWTNVADAGSPVTYEWESSYTNNVDSTGAFTTQLASRQGLTSPSVYSPGTPDNKYFWHVRAKDAAGNYSAWTSPWAVTVQTSPTSKDECKKDGWKLFTDPTFRNQGDCVNWVEHNEKKIKHDKEDRHKIEVENEREHEFGHVQLPRF